MFMSLSKHQLLGIAPPLFPSSDHSFAGDVWDCHAEDTLTLKSSKYSRRMFKGIRMVEEERYLSA